MKKNFTKYAGIAMVALLTACNGSAVTKEEAAKVAKGITTHQKEDENLYKQFHIVTKETTYDKDGKAYNTTSEVWVNTDKHFIHLKSEELTDDYKIEKSEGYMGEIDSKYYSIDMGKKEYTQFESLTAFEVIYKSTVSGSAFLLGMMGSGEYLETMVASAKDEPTEEDPVFEFKSKGEGHLYLKVTEKSKDEESGADITEESVIIFNNYVLASVEGEVTNSKAKEECEKGRMTVDYNVSVNMPSLNGLTKK